MYVHERTERDKCDAHVRRIGRDAGRARAEDRVVAVEAVDCRATAAGFSLVARRRRVIKVGTARALHQVAANGGHVAQLRGSAGEDGGGEQGITLLDKRMVGEV